MGCHLRDTYSCKYTVALYGRYLTMYLYKCSLSYSVTSSERENVHPVFKMLVTVFLNSMCRFGIS